MGSAAQGRVLLGLCATSLACNGSLSPPVVDAGLRADEAAPADVASLGDDAPEANADRAVTLDVAEKDAPVPLDLSLDLTIASLPPGVPAPRLLVPGPLRLIGDGASACTNQVPPSGNGDRWCGFKRPAAGGTGTELWVIDVTKASASSVVCDGTSPDCLRLTSTLWIDEPIGGPYQEDANRFQGDTLVFHADAVSTPEEPFAGPIYVWRPGWASPRRIVAQGYSCSVHESALVAFCDDHVTYQGVVASEIDVLTGSVADPAGGVLTKLDHVRLRRADGEPAFGGRFTRAGDAFVYSKMTAGSATASLWVAKLTATGAEAPTEILPDVLDWSLSHDGTRIFYFREFTNNVGKLTVADFPSGKNARLISSRSGRYEVLGDGDVDRGAGFFVDPGGRFYSEYRVVPDLDNPLSSVVVFRYRPPLEDFHLSRDGRFTGYAKADDNGFNGYIAHTNGSSECVLNSVPDRPAFEYAFLDNSSLVFWSEQSLVDSQAKDGWLADPDGCVGKQRFAAKLAYYRPVRNAGLIYADEEEDETFSLKYAILERGRWPAAGPVRVRDRIDLPVSVLDPAMSQIVFQVSTGPPEQVGLYFFGPIPFPAP